MSDIPVSTSAKRKASEDLEDSSDKKTKMVAEEDSENDTEDDDEDRDGDTDDHDDSDEESKQYDVEEYQHTLPSSRVVDLKLYISKDELGGDWSDWTYDIVVECKYKGEVIGTAFGRYIDRRPIRNNFYVNMEEVAHEMSELAFEIFDRYGYLKTELKEHPVRKGTGAFGEEMDHGGLLLFERIHLQMEWRRQGLGTVMVKALLKKAEEQKQGLRFAVSLPGNLNTSDLDDELKGKTKRERLFITDREFDTAVSFIRALGFRRIGGAIWFCLPSDPDHKARFIAAVDDYDPPDRERMNQTMRPKMKRYKVLSIAKIY
ncbi:hypothetical protein B7494_g3693 [Chlorociboria aeruginascens]|nr:hypothetical protein B7494_g3693 [Chlorociboria aeruginascens]